MIGSPRERRREDRTEENGTYRSETVDGSFERAILLPHGVKQDDISASYENGILEVVVPKAAQLNEGHRAPVQVNGERKALRAKGRKKD